MTSAAAAIRATSGSGRATCQVRSANSCSGQSSASAWTSCGSEIVTAPVSAGSVSTRIALEQGRGQLLGAVDLVEVLRQRAEGVVDGDVAGPRQLELLEHGGGGARREGARGQQQHRQAVDGGQRRAGEHVRRARADRGRAHPGLEAVLLAGVGDRRVHHRLLVPREDVGQSRAPRRPRWRAPPPGAAPGRYPRRCRDRRCRSTRRRAAAAHRRARSTGWPGSVRSPGRRSAGRCRSGGSSGFPPTGSRGSTGSSAQPSRTQAWAGSSQMRHARSGPGPAMTLR